MRIHEGIGKIKNRSQIFELGILAIKVLCGLALYQPDQKSVNIQSETL